MAVAAVRVGRWMAYRSTVFAVVHASTSFCVSQFNFNIFLYLSICYVELAFHLAHRAMQICSLVSLLSN